MRLLAATPTHIASIYILQSRVDQLASQLRNQLGDQAYQRAWEEGRLRPFDDVVAELLAQYAVRSAQHPPMSLQQLNARLINPLTQREFDILGLLVEGCSNAEMGGKLFLSLNTVRTHLKHLYSKLGVDSRARAIARVHDLI